VERGDLPLARGDGIEDAGHEADAGAVAEFGVFKAEVTDFAQRGAPIRVAMRIPTS